MHEDSILQALLERVGQEARVRDDGAVARVHLAIGRVSGAEIVPESFELEVA